MVDSSQMDSSADRTPARLAVDHSNKRAEVELASGLVLAGPLSGRAAEPLGGSAAPTTSPTAGS
jgi:hypothetical protein